MKRVISLSFILFANINLLVHLVIPHHHHEKTGVCFIESHCKDCKEAHRNCSPTHEDESNPVSKRCCIDNVFPPEPNDVNTTCRLHKKCDCGHVLLFALIPNTLNTLDFVDDTVIHFRQNPYVPLSYADYISQSLGLRAPPVC